MTYADFLTLFDDAWMHRFRCAGLTQEKLDAFWERMVKGMDGNTTPLTPAAVRERLIKKYQHCVYNALRRKGPTTVN